MWLKSGCKKKSTGAEGDFTSRQSQTQIVSHFPRTAVITPLEVHIKQNYKDEARNIALYAKKHDTALIAHNGKVSNLTQVQWLAVRLQSFKKWFGDWENDPANASKIVDENSEPLVVYHGTARSKPISIFKSGKSGYLGPGIYFTPEKRTASKYTGMYGDGLVYEGFVNMRNPLAISYADKPAKVILNADKSLAALEQQARDAVAEATGTFGFSTYTTRQLSRSYATDAAGNKLDADAFITTPNGNLDWYIFPQDEKTQKLLAARGIKNLPIRLTVASRLIRRIEVSA